MSNDNVLDQLKNSTEISEWEKKKLFDFFEKIKKKKINILITGATGSGKSSTINALFQSEKAKVGTTSRPETMDIRCYEYDNLILWDSPGLGDGKEEDIRHAKAIIEKLTEKDKNGDLLIDVVLVILDGSSRDLGTSFELINNVIIPNLGEDRSRLIIGINQADMAMKGRFWNNERNEPEGPLIDFLEQKVESTKERIKNATGVTVDPIYYSAGYKDEFEEQQPFNLSKLLLSIINHVKPGKRILIAKNINQNEKMWEKDDRLEDYQEEINKSFMDSVVKGAEIGAELGEKLGSTFGAIGKNAGKAIGYVAGAILGGVTSFFK